MKSRKIGMIGAAAALALGAGLAGAPMIRPEPPKLRRPISFTQTRRQRKREEQKEERRRANVSGQIRNRQGRYKQAHKLGFQAAVNKMTNHERNIWARSGYPGLKETDIEKLRPFAAAAIRGLAHATPRELAAQ